MQGIHAVKPAAGGAGGWGDGGLGVHLAGPAVTAAQDEGRDHGIVVVVALVAVPSTVVCKDGGQGRATGEGEGARRGSAAMKRGSQVISEIDGRWPGGAGGARGGRQP